MPRTASASLSPEQHLYLALHSLARQFGRRPLVSDYRELLERDPGLPSFNELHSAYGSWAATLEAAGLNEAEQSPVWNDVHVDGQTFPVDMSIAAVLELADQVHFLEEVASERGFDLWENGIEWVVGSTEARWADSPRARDTDQD